MSYQLKIRITQINVPLDYTDTDVLKRSGRKVGCHPSLLKNITIIRRSLDARERNPAPQYVLSVEADLSMERLPKQTHHDVEIIDNEQPEVKPVPIHKTQPRPVVVGAGPAGLMAAWQLATSGCKPLLVERGDAAEDRAPLVQRFWQDGTLDPESNVFYGEGGAGLFSDGKLNSRSKQRGLIHDFFQVLVECGANPDILIDAAPHIGSDELLKLVPTLRRRILALGGEIRFRSSLNKLIIHNGKLQAVVVNEEEIPCTACYLAVGHSARDVYQMLDETGVALEAKPFAVGIRLEVPQVAIDIAQYGKFAADPRLGAASFRLTRKESGDIRSCYSFCMCPGGCVIACASEAGMLTTNGMSYSKRAMSMGNAAFLVPVNPADYPGESVFGGVDFQRAIEQRAFAAGGGGYATPAVMLDDFLKGHQSSSLPEDLSCKRSAPAEFRDILPDFIIHTLERSIRPMLKELDGINLAEAVLYAAETRSSSPIRILRDDNSQSVNTVGLYPIGEGSGYAGGIVSSAIDGIRSVAHWMQSTD